MSDKKLILLYDGVCRFCNSSVLFILRHDKKGTMRFSALQSEYSQKIVARFPYLKTIDSVILLSIDNNETVTVYIRSTAALEIFRYLNGIWNLFLIFYIVPAFVRDIFYNTFAHYRYKVFGKYDSCLLPSSEVRSRFID